MNNEMTVWLIYNSSAGSYSQDKVKKLEELLKTERISLTVIATKDREHTMLVALDACLKQVHTILVAGGDGTLRDVVNGIVNYRAKNNSDLPQVAIFPIGTANLVAKSLTLQFNVLSVSQTIFSKHIKT